MDGFDSLNGVIVFAATNRIELLDSALTRAGRFDRVIKISNPNIKERAKIFNLYLKNLPLNEEEWTKEKYVLRLSALTPGFTGA